MRPARWRLGQEALETEGRTPLGRAMMLDRAWFAAYPHARTFLRPAIPGEFWPHSDEEAWKDAHLPSIPEGCEVARMVEVMREGPGQRTRHRCYVVRPVGPTRPTMN